MIGAKVVERFYLMVGPLTYAEKAMQWISLR